MGILENMQILEMPLIYCGPDHNESQMHSNRVVTRVDRLFEITLSEWFGLLILWECVGLLTAI